MIRLTLLAALLVVCSSCATVPRERIVVEAEKDANGEPILDATGRPILKPMRDDDGKVVTSLVLDDAGNVQTDQVLTPQGAAAIGSAVEGAATLIPGAAPALGLIELLGMGGVAGLLNALTGTGRRPTP